MVILIGLPNKQKILKYISGIANGGSFAAQMLYFTAVPKTVIIGALVGFSIIRAFTDKG
jgi:Na+-transporting NADH:ubiquinone oxidoreductase subunit NqrD